MKPTILGFAVIIAGVLLLAWALFGGFAACPAGETGETFQKTIATLDGTIELGLKLSVALIGAGAAVILGLKTGIRMTQRVKAVLFTAIILFGESAIAGVLWRLRLANAWLNGCLALVTTPYMTRLFDAAFYLFIAGLLATLVMVSDAAWGKASKEEQR